MPHYVFVNNQSIPYDEWWKSLSIKERFGIKMQETVHNLRWKTEPKITAALEMLGGKPPYSLQSDDELNNHFRRLLYRHDRKTIKFVVVPICPYCFHWSKAVAWRRRNTAYVNDKNNWLLSCDVCFDEDYQNFQELWEDYYSSRF